MNSFNAFKSLLEKRAAVDCDRIAYRFLPNDQDEVSITYGALLTEAVRLASLIRKEIPNGQRVLLIYPAGLEFIKVFYACLLARVVAVPLPSPRANEINNHLKHVVVNCEPAAIFTDRSLLENVRSQLDQEYQKIVVATDYEFNEIPIFPSKLVANLDIALLQYTSGSTSKPKGVILKTSNLLANLRQIEIAFGHTCESIGVIWLPHYHDMGLIGGILQPLFVGFPVTLFSPIAFIQKPQRWLQAIHKYRATTSGGPNFAYDLCVYKAKSIKDDLDLTSWNLAFNGAEQVKAETLKKFGDTFARYGFSPKSFVPCYGLAEATLLVSSAHIQDRPLILDASDTTIKSTSLAIPMRDQLVSSGPVAKDVRIEIRRQDSDEYCDAGEVGEIVIFGENVASGYWNRQDKAFSANSGSFRTGDLGFQLKDELFVTGRLSDLIVIRGKNLFPEDIEATMRTVEPLLTLDGVAAFSIDGDTSEELILLQEVNGRAGRSVNLSNICNTVFQLIMQRHGVSVSKYVPVRAGSLVRTSSGKISRFACKQLYLNNKIQQLSF